MRPFVILFGLCAILGFIAVGQAPPASLEATMYSGRIEIDALMLACEPGGTLDSVPVREGDWARKGQLMAALDLRELQSVFDAAHARIESARAAASAAAALAAHEDSQWSHQVEESTAALERAKELASVIESGPRVQVVRRAEAAVEIAKARFAEANRELERVKKLERGQSISQDTMDRALTAVLVRKQELASARATLDEAEEGSRTQDIAAARAEVGRLKAVLKGAHAGHERVRAAELEAKARMNEIAAAQADVNRASARLSKGRIHAPFDGLVDEILLRPGEVARPGEPILRLLDFDRPYLTVFVTSEVAQGLGVGEDVQVKVDFAPNPSFTGKIARIGRQAEFTPKDVQTRERRASLVYEVRIDIKDPKHELKAGQPADLVLK